MAPLKLPYCQVNLSENRSYSVQIRHYDRLRDAFDKRECGPIELELFEHPAGRCLIRLEEIVDVGYYPQDWVDARLEQRAQQKLAGEED